MTDASRTSLGPTSYIVLGMLSQHGPATSYDLKRWVDESVGYFWSFPRSQLYAEPQRLAAAGLLQEQQEPDGRRRRVYRLTEAGQAALTAWLATPAGSGELRDPGLLKLFFAPQDDRALQRAIAAEQLSLHQTRLDEYRHIMTVLCGPDEQQAAHALRMGLLYEEASVQFWSGLLAEPAPAG
ncbi:PadR family transcriptional regulator [Deinococcus sonorensis]|uniref:PadR family transcriptional regulator n=2 Tax=Deinococcus sonorensis TaxID=309891 RepID=A0AAU7UF38_9DEIO